MSAAIEQTESTPATVPMFSTFEALRELTLRALADWLQTDPDARACQRQYRTASNVTATTSNPLAMPIKLQRLAEAYTPQDQNELIEMLVLSPILWRLAAPRGARSLPTLAAELIEMALFDALECQWHTLAMED